MNRAHLFLIPALAATALACATTTSQTQTPPPAPVPEEKPAPPPPAPVEEKPAPEPAPAPPSLPVEIDRAQFTMTGPAGYREIDDPSFAPIKNAGGVVILRESAAQGLYPSSIVVTQIPAAIKPVEKPEKCQEIAGTAANANATTLKGSRLVETKAGPSCQFDLVATNDPVRLARGTIVVGATSWTLTCNYDARDEKALAECDAATQSFTFKPDFATPPEEKAPAKGKKGKKKK